MAKISVMGTGSWGTALALLLCKNGHDVTVWSYKEEEVRTLSEKREHVSKLPGVKIPNEIFFTADLKEAVEGKDVVVLAVPSIHVRNTAKKMNAYVKGGQILVDVAKGIEEDTLMTLSQQIEEEIPQADVAVLSETAPVAEVQLVGTKTKPAAVTSVSTASASAQTGATISGNTIVDANGNVLNVARVITGECTAYTGGGITATGAPAAVGRVAVNPNIIPYGTKLYIASPDGSVVYGYAIASDTGGALMSGRVLVDLYYNTLGECVNFGRRQMNVYILA